MENSQETYECQCNDCLSDGTFEAAPREWWQKKGMEPPTRCPKCRTWIKCHHDLGDVDIPCHGCGKKFRFSAKTRVYEHVFRDGWDEFKSDFKCRRCQAQPGWNERANFRCQVVGCRQTFEGPSSRTLERNNWSAPTVCPDCKAEDEKDRERGDVSVACANAHCGFSWNDSAKARIWRRHHGETGPLYCRRCREQPERRRLHSYQCKCAGCSNGKAFEDRHESFFPKGPPTTCSTCRDWIRQQHEIGPLGLTCCVCMAEFTVEVNERQFYHIQVGNWKEAHDDDGQFMCHACRNDLVRRGFRLSARYNADRRRLKKGIMLDSYEIDELNAFQEEARDMAQEHGLFGQACWYDVPTDSEYYTGIGDGKHENAYQHISRSDHGFERIGVSCGQERLHWAVQLARRTDTNVAEGVDGDHADRPVKVDLETGQVVVLVPDSRSTTGWRILTTYVVRGVSSYIGRKMTGQTRGSNWKAKDR